MNSKLVCSKVLSNIKYGEFSEKILYPLTMHRASDRVRLDSNSLRAAVSSDDLYMAIAPNAQEHEILCWLIKRSQKRKQTKCLQFSCYIISTSGSSLDHHWPPHTLNHANLGIKVTRCHLSQVIMKIK